MKSRDELLAALPLMRDERDRGYIIRDAAKYEFQEAARFIREHHYQKAFFERTYENTGGQEQIFNFTLPPIPPFPLSPPF